MGIVAFIVAVIAGTYALIYGAKRKKWMGGAGMVICLIPFPFAGLIGAGVALRAYSLARVDRMIRAIGEDDE